jgi:uncharacterized NAD(P)/FAD-binding protein YdhS
MRSCRLPWSSTPSGRSRIIRKSTIPLIKNLMRRGLISPGPAGLGLDAQPNGAIIGRDGTASRILYTLGSPMKGVLWEVIAAPEIRVQAEQLAGLLLSDKSSLSLDSE